MKHTKQNNSWLKTRFLFLRMIWRVLTNKEDGWIFFKMDDKQQISFLKNDKTVIVNIRYMGVDKRVVEKIVERMETSPYPKIMEN